MQQSWDISLLPGCLYEVQFFYDCLFWCFPSVIVPQYPLYIYICIYMVIFHGPFLRPLCMDKGLDIGGQSKLLGLPKQEPRTTRERRIMQEAMGKAVAAPCPMDFPTSFCLPVPYGFLV